MKVLIFEKVCDNNLLMSSKSKFPSSLTFNLLLPPSTIFSQKDFLENQPHRAGSVLLSFLNKILFCKIYMFLGIIKRMAVHKTMMRFDSKVLDDPWVFGCLAAELIHNCRTVSPVSNPC